MKRKTVAVIGNEFDWAYKSGYSFANGLYYELSKKYFVKIVIPMGIMDIFEESETHLNPNMVIKKIFLSKNTASKLVKTEELFYWERFIYEDETIRNELISEVGDADVIICNSVYISKLVLSSFENRSVVFRELDTFYYGYCENFAYVPLADDEKEETRLLTTSTFFELEKEAAEKASFILTLTEGDEAIFRGQYYADPKRMLRMPLCIKNADRYDGFIPRERTNSDGRLNCVYISNRYFGSDMLVFKILSIAPGLPNINFHIIGSCCMAITDSTLPENCFSYGIIPEIEKKRILNIADCALSIPHQSHGMNAKNFDYILNGLTMLADREGIRGYNMPEDTHYFPVTFDTLEDDLKRFSQTDYSRRRQIALNAYTHAISEFRYENYIPKFEELTGLAGLASRTDCCVWGAGFAGRDCYIKIKNTKYNCIGFIDNDGKKQGTEVLGQPVFAFESVVNMALDLDVTIIIAINSIKFISEVYRQISSALPSNEIILCYYGVLYEDNIDFNKLLESGWIE